MATSGRVAPRPYQYTRQAYGPDQPSSTAKRFTINCTTKFLHTHHHSRDSDSRPELGPGATRPACSPARSLQVQDRPASIPLGSPSYTLLLTSNLFPNLRRRFHQVASAFCSPSSDLLLPRLHLAFSSLPLLFFASPFPHPSSLHFGKSTHTHLAFSLRPPSHRPANLIARPLTRRSMARASAFGLSPLHTSPDSDFFTLRR
jgi:hypothetical protein